MIGAFIQGTAMMYIGLYTRFANPAEYKGDGVPAGGIVGIIFIYMYSVGWSFGHSIAPYVTAAEIFPSRIRSTCVGFCLFANWYASREVSLNIYFLPVSLANRTPTGS